jgi:hypothetical protein
MAVAFGLVLVIGSVLARALIPWWRLRRFGYRPFWTAPLAGSGHHFDPGRSASFRGGGANAPMLLSVPLVRLEVDPMWAHLTASRERIDVWIPQTAISEVQTVGMFGTTAFRFASPTGDFDGVLFFTTAPEKLLAALTASGWPIAARPTRRRSRGGAPPAPPPR